MADVAKKITQIGPVDQESAPKPDEKPWLRQKNEPALWYMRFKRYLEMGPKRSLRAVVASEPDTRGASKSTEKQKEKSLSDVSVSGAWKRASKNWHWPERAREYDLAQMERYAGYVRKVAIEQAFASKAYRLIYLCSIANALHEHTKFGMSLDENVKFAKTMQSLFKDIAHEMEGVDETTLMMADASAQKRLLEVAEETRKVKH